MRLKEKIVGFVPHFTVDQINENTLLIDDLLFDSLMMMELVVDLEEEFNITIEAEDLSTEKLNKFSELLKFIS